MDIRQPAASILDQHGCLFRDVALRSFIAFGLAWKLTALSDGTERAKGLGINTDRLRIFVFTISSVLVSSAVALSGPLHS